MLKREKLLYKTIRFLYNFWQNETRSFEKNMFGGETTLQNDSKYQSDLLNSFIDFKKITK